MTRPKVIAITLLAVLAVLGSASAVVFAPNGDTALTLQLDPTSGCPGTTVSLGVILPYGDATQSAGGVIASDGAGKQILTSYPDGLITKAILVRLDGEIRGQFTVGDSVCAGDYVVTLELPPASNGVGNGQIPTSVSTHFTVGGQGCPGLPACRPVGGVVMPTNTLAIATPYLALAGLIVAVSAVVVVKRRRD